MLLLENQCVLNSLFSVCWFWLLDVSRLQFSISFCLFGDRGILLVILVVLMLVVFMKWVGIIRLILVLVLLRLIVVVRVCRVISFLFVLLMCSLRLCSFDVVVYSVCWWCVNCVIRLVLCLLMEIFSNRILLFGLVACVSVIMVRYLVRMREVSQCVV